MSAQTFATNFQIKAERPNFPEIEEEVLKFWNQINAMELQLKHTENKPLYTFYDGPPFATGLPHYGHIGAGTIKDVVLRYASMNGYHVPKRFGWDCHGLPIEFQIDKQLGITNRKQILDLGIDVYNEKCRSIVLTYSEQWKSIVQRLGRWIDIDNAYRTMDRDYMESVWWVFRQIFDKDLVYRGCKIMPYSNGCMTVLSNFEAQQNYQDVSDPSIVITFPLISDPKVSFLAWTTTPWTLPANLALSVNPNFTYVEVEDLKTNKNYILAKCRLSELYKSGQIYSLCEKSDYKEPQNVQPNNEFKILREFKGKEMEGQDYLPLFDYYYEEMKPKGCFKILCGTHVTDDAGTGIVHTAPAFGAEDYQISREYNIIHPDDPCVCIDDSGIFIDKVKDFSGRKIKETDKDIIQFLKEKDRLIKSQNFVHSYPMCWRSETPLIYKAVHCWFIKVTELKDRLLANNLKSKWVPEFAQMQRFQKWLENANDWCFSRNRYWGCPIPIWASDDMEEFICIGSAAELIERAGLPKDTQITDLHMHNIDHITIPSSKGKGVLKRIPETFDCWFESGSMPYAQQGVPNKMDLETFKNYFPADFIGEGIDQTRGWFYTLNVIGTALYDDCPYKNLIVNGIVRAADGKKLSKSKKNFTDPLIIVNQYGADALRLYLMNSPLVRGQDLKFRDEGVLALIKDVFLPWYQLMRLIIQEINRFEGKAQKQFVYNHSMFQEGSEFKFENTFDRWIIAQTQEVLKFTHEEFKHYRLGNVLKKQLNFLNDLSNWYVNMNKTRFKGGVSVEDTEVSLNVLFYSFFNCIVSMAPYVPFISEYFYQDMKKVISKDSGFQELSIHLIQMPKANDKFVDVDLVKSIEIFQELISSIRKERELNKISKKQPLRLVTISPKSQVIKNNLVLMSDFIKEHANVLEVKFEDNFQKNVNISFKPNIEKLKEALEDKSMFGVLFPAIKKLGQKEIEQFSKDEQLEVQFQYKGQESKFTLDQENTLIQVDIALKSDDKQIVAGSQNFVYQLEKTIDVELKRGYLAREITNRIQKSRKEAGVLIEDRIAILITIEQDQSDLLDTIQTQLDQISKNVKKPVLFNQDIISQLIGKFNYEIKDENLTVSVLKCALEVLVKPGNPSYQMIRNSLQQANYSELSKVNQFKIQSNGEEIILEKDNHYRLLQMHQIIIDFFMLKFYNLMKRTISSTKGKVIENLVVKDLQAKFTKEQCERRNQIFDRLFVLQQEKLKSEEKRPIQVTLPDGKVIKGVQLETTPLSIAQGISKNLAESSIVAKVTYTNRYSTIFAKVIDCDQEEEGCQQDKETSQIISLNTPLEGDCKVELLGFDSSEGKETFWHSSAHILGKSLEQLYGGFLTHGPPLQEGFFYDCYMGDKKITLENYKQIEQTMSDLVSKKAEFQQLILTKEEALELLADNPFKVQLIQAKIKDGDRTSAYRVGDFVDLCTGPHIDNTRKIKAVSILSNSASYWLGNQSLDDLQRVYAITFPAKDQLKEYTKLKEELKKRDHRNVGEQQKLFIIHPFAPGCIFFLPHGT